MIVRIAFVISAVVVLSTCRGTTNPMTNCDVGFASSGGRMLEVQFVEALRIRGCQDQLRSEVGANLWALDAVLGRVGVIEIRPLISVPRDRLEAMYADARALGESPSDLLSWHRLLLSADADVATAIDELRSRPEVQYVYVVSNIVPPPGASDVGPR